MAADYFHRTARDAATKLWVNNPSAEDAARAIEAGAIGCTTNPQFCQKLLQLEPDYIRGVIDNVIQDVDDNDVAAERIYQVAASRIMEIFMPLYEQSDGAFGYVTIQGDPRCDSDATAIVDEALRFHALGENYMAKIPVTLAGMEAIEDLVARGVPVCATEVFSVSQAVHCCETYRRVVEKSGARPPFYVTHITGILDQYWCGVVESEHIEVSPDALAQAGCTVAREEYRILRERGYEATMLGGGARGTQHFTEMVGADMCITLNWSTARELLEADGPVVQRIDAHAPARLVDELRLKLPNFRRALDEGALVPEEYEDFGPLVLFRANFLNGYARLIDEIADRRGQVGGEAERLEASTAS